MTIGGGVEGRFFPVVANTHIIHSIPVGETSSRIWGEADRIRNCSFERIEWRLGTPRRSSLAAVKFEETAKVRDTGKFEFGPWRIALTPEQIHKRSYAVVFHRCHPLWLTETRFYP
jgi:hypothetical protein